MGPKHAALHTSRSLVIYNGPPALQTLRCVSHYPIKIDMPNIAQHSCPPHASPLAAALLPCASCAGNCEGSLKKAAYALSEVACQFGVRLDGVSSP